MIPAKARDNRLRYEPTNSVYYRITRQATRITYHTLRGELPTRLPPKAVCHGMLGHAMSCQVMPCHVMLENTTKMAALGRSPRGYFCQDVSQSVSVYALPNVDKISSSGYDLREGGSSPVFFS